MTIRIRPAGAADFAALDALQRDNLHGALTPAQRADGFLSAAFSHEQWRRMSDDLGIDAAFDDGELVAYLCAFRCADRPRPAVIEAMLDAFTQTRFDGRALEQDDCYLYGPVCIARAHRGGTLLAQLFAAQRARLAPAFARGAAFIAESNPRSLRAHTHKLGMRIAGGFRCNGNGYHIVAFHTREPGASHGQQ